MTLLSELRAAGAEAELKDGRVVLRHAAPHLVEKARAGREEIRAALALEAEVFRTWTGQMIGLCLGLRQLIEPMVIEAGDDASIALEDISWWLRALRNHEIHGRNWLAKHGPGLRRRLRVLLPHMFEDKPVEGQELYDLMAATFARRSATAPTEQAAEPRQEGLGL